MRNHVAVLALVLGVAAPSVALAQEGTVSGAAGGAATGAVIGGPVGAAVGGVAGAVVGTIVAPPREVKTYVVKEERPSVAYEGEVVVGEPLPEAVEVYEVPDSDYRYTVVNEKRYIVDGDRRVVEVVE
ncbi:hypothetical protein GCM10008171_04360 [Methylopila jiangsuensis]|uniref:DUF1236 domain-containing protein n=1 Tax=Methylopila jiangsuensis TaxID=586230 RepID=A0A9W6JDB9_9HYPH|nr:DUF1236 domain-containing protein [Methylopila jiangsuensis]MDR6285424.1 phage tail tape-measure protein [Methylopila jiangsuensis]GLK75182.1 hypothetical protein GCM10008171_04360 [Methylopila jiangsuensis]